MAVYKDVDGKWRFRKSLKLAGGRRERISGTPSLNSRTAAEKAEREAIDRLENPGNYPDMASKAVAEEVFSTFVAEWLKTYPAAQNKESTVIHRELHVRMHLLPYWKDTPLHLITAQALMRFVAELRNKDVQRNTTGKNRPGTLVTKLRKAPAKLASQTVLNILRTMHKVLASAVAWGKLKSMPEFPKVKVAKADWDWLDKNESALVLGHTSSAEERAVLLFALKTGARGGEQLAILWDDLDFVNMTISIKRSMFRGTSGTTKTGKERVVHMAPSLADALKKIRHLKGPLVFCDESGRPLKLWHLKSVLRRCLKRAGLRQVRWHDLRHSFASQLVQMGVNLRQVQEWLGHSSITMTTRYSHLAPTDGQRLIALLDEKVG